MILLEAMVLSTPIVAHAVGGIPNVCQNSRHCWLTDDNTVENLAHTLLECLQNPLDCHTRTKLAKTHACKHYSAEANAESYKKLYKGIIKKKSNVTALL